MMIGKKKVSKRGETSEFTIRSASSSICEHKDQKDVRAEEGRISSSSVSNRATQGSSNVEEVGQGGSRMSQNVQTRRRERGRRRMISTSGWEGSGKRRGRDEKLQKDDIVKS